MATADNYVPPLLARYANDSPTLSLQTFLDVVEGLQGAFGTIALHNGQAMACTTRPWAATFHGMRLQEWLPGLSDDVLFDVGASDAPFMPGWLDSLVEDARDVRHPSGALISTTNNIKTCGFAAVSRGGLWDFNRRFPGVINKVSGLELDALAFSTTDSGETVIIDTKRGCIYDAAAKGKEITEQACEHDARIRSKASCFVPYQIMQTVGDGLTDGPMFAATKAAGGITILVGDPDSAKTQRIIRALGYSKDGGLIDVGPVPADYSPRGAMSRVLAGLKDITPTLVGQMSAVDRRLLIGGNAFTISGIYLRGGATGLTSEATVALPQTPPRMRSTTQTPNPLFAVR